MSPIEEFSEMAVTLQRTADAVRAAFPDLSDKGARFSLFVAAATEEAKLREYHVDQLIPFFQHFHNVHESRFK